MTFVRDPNEEHQRPLVPEERQSNDTDSAPFRGAYIGTNPVHYIRTVIVNLPSPAVPFVTVDITLARWIYLDNFDPSTFNGGPGDFRIALGDSSAQDSTGGFFVSVGLFIKAGGFRRFTVWNPSMLVGRAVRVTFGSDPDFVIWASPLATRFNFNTGL